MLTWFSNLHYKFLLINSGHTRDNDAKRRTTWNFLKTLIVGMFAGFGLIRILILTFPNLSSIQSNSDADFFDYKFEENDSFEAVDTGVGLHIHDNEDTTIADKLFDEVRVLCWVSIYPENHNSSAQHVKNTWGRRCNKLIFMSSIEDTELGTVALPLSGKEQKQMWAKTKEAFKYIYEHHLDEYDWFLKADEDTYVVVENLRKMLYGYSTNYPIYLGSKVKGEENEVYNKAGPGYVLSKEALKRFIEKALPDKNRCRPDGMGLDDAELGKCLLNVDVLSGDSRDEHKRGTMFGYGPGVFLNDDIVEEDPFRKSLYYNIDKGINCCSDHAISFHKLTPSLLYSFDYLIYHLRPFGISHHADVLPQKKSLNDIVSALSDFNNYN